MLELSLSVSDLDYHNKTNKDNSSNHSIGSSRQKQLMVNTDSSHNNINHALTAIVVLVTMEIVLGKGSRGFSM